jgi:oligosaccharyltransferase complex subunit delta (ribophorin II)
MGITLNAESVMKHVAEGLKASDVSVINQVFAVQAASLLAKTKQHHSDVFTLVEDIVGQADEVNGKYLQLEGGLGVTAFFIEGAFKLAAKLDQQPQILKNKLQQLAAYVMSRRDSQNVKNVYFVLLAAQTLSDNKYMVPVAVTLSSGRTLTTGEQASKIQVKVSTLMGSQLPGGVGAVTADQVNRPADGVVVMNKEALKQSASDKTLYELDLMKVKPNAGFYTVTLSVAEKTAGASSSKDKAPAGQSKLVGLAPGQAKLDVKVSSELSVNNFNIAVIDGESSSTTNRQTPVVHPESLKQPLSADYSQKVIATFKIQDKHTGRDFAPHQVFMRLLHVSSDQEVFFVCEKSTGNQYEFELNIKSSEKAFRSLSGDYEMHLIVGDAVVTNSFVWNIGQLAVTFYDGQQYSAPSFLVEYQPKPEIHHKFREPEPRPAIVFSQLFAAAAVLPLIGLIVAWSRLGVNLDHFQVSDLATLGFHGGLAAIFGLYYCYWAHLNMFQTMKYLVPLGLLTFFAGHKLLRRLALNRLKQKTLGAKKDE